MSRIFDALRRSEEGRARQERLASAADLVDVLESRQPVLRGIAETDASLHPDARLVVQMEPAGLGAERYRQLRARLMQCQKNRPIKTLLISSSVPGEGKTVTVLNLAAALAKKPDTKVLIIDADLRNPNVGRLLGLPSRPGLSEVLQGQINPFVAIRKVRPLGFYVLSASQPTLNPLDLLQSAASVELLKNMGTCFDWILLDSPPVVTVADAQVLSTYADGTLLVVRQDVSVRDSTVEAIRMLGADKILGLLLNGMSDTRFDYYKYYLAAGAAAGSSPRPGNSR